MIISKKYFFYAVCVSIILNSCIKEDNGVAPALNLPKLSAENTEVAEADLEQVFNIPIALQGENKTNVVVEFATLKISADDLDFEIITKSPLIFKPGENLKNISFKLSGDEAKEVKESFDIKLYNPKNATLAKDLVSVSILDDDDNTAGLVIPKTGYESPESYAGYKLAWADEFQTETLDASAWTHETGGGGWGNNELQYYREDNTSFAEGKMIITAKKQNFGNNQYTSSRIITKGKKFFKFGRIDIRAALPKGKGLWPALWMLGTNIDAVSWPSCGEIDIMELTGDLPNRVLSTVHYGPNVAGHQFKSNSKYLSGGKNFHDEFHVFSINWEVDKMEFMIDNEIYHTITPANLGTAAYPFNKNFFFIFNVAVGGNLPGNPDSSSPFPQSMIVDYVRVFSKS